MTEHTGNGWAIRSGKWSESPPEMVDHVISDPPFTDHVSAKANTRTGLYVRGQLQIVQKPNASTGEALSFGGVNERDVAQVLPLVKRWTVLKCAIEQVGRYEDACPELYTRGMVWTKPNPTPQFTGDRPGMWGESLAVFHSAAKKRWNGGGKAGRYDGANIRNNEGDSAWDERVHETQMPLWLAAALVRDFTEPGELVWDPYTGSGTIGVACVLTGRRFLGHEMQDGDPWPNDYVSVAVGRLRAAEGGQALGEYRAGQIGLFGGAS